METQLIRAALLGPKVVTVCLFMKIFLGRTYDTIEAYLKSNPFVAQHLDVEELPGHSHSERNVELAEAAGLGIGEYGLEVNEYIQTSDPNIYAGGDLIEYEHLITKNPIPGQIRPNTVIGGGRIIAKNALGYKIEFPKLLNCFATKLFDKSIASVGVTEAIAREDGFDIFVTNQAAKSKYVMMECGKPYTVKLIFDRDTKKVIGAQIIADDERSVRYIDVIALAIRNGWTALDLTTLRCAGQPELSPEPSAEPITVAAEGAFKELYPLPV